jgi:membrane associated rhomboid family serine protease
VIPIQDVIPTRLVPVATYVLLGLNVVAYLSRGGALGELSPVHGLTGTSLSAVPDALRALLDHGSPVQFGVNLLSLWLFGGTVEDQLGRLRFVGLYGVGGLIGALLPGIMDLEWRGPVLGANLAIAAVMGAYGVLFPNAKVLMLVPMPIALHEVPAAILIVAWCTAQFLALVSNLAAADAPEAAFGVALATYALAFAVGAVLGLALRRRERSRVEWWDAIR